MTQAAASQPLSGIKVIDLSRVLSGPLCASMLADLGAEVIKVEIPGQGDDSRLFGPDVRGESAYFLQMNRGKQSIALDLKSAEGLDLARRLIAGADVLVENFRPGVTQRLGLDYDALRDLNPRLVYVSISGFGQDGPLARRPAYDHIVQAMGGIMSGTGWPGGPPTRVGDAIGDVVAGVYGAWGALAALLHRDRNGQGQHVDVAMLDTMMSLQMLAMTQLVGGAEPPGRLGNAHPISAPMDAFAAADGHVVIAVANDALFARLAAALGRPQLTQDPRFATDPDRLRHQDDLRAIIEGWTGVRGVDQVVAELEAAGVPAGPIWDLKQALASEHALHRRLVRPAAHPRGGEAVQVMPQPVRLSGVTEEPDLGAPGLGADTDRVLAGLGLSAAEIADLRARGVAG